MERSRVPPPAKSLNMREIGAPPLGTIISEPRRGRRRGDQFAPIYWVNIDGL